MKSNLWVFLSILLASAVILGSCAPAAPVQPEEQKSPAVPDGISTDAATDQTKVLIFVGFGTGSEAPQIAAHKAIQAEYNRTHQDIQIEFMTVTYEEHLNRFSALLASDQVPDIVMPIGVAGIAEFYEEWADITPYIVKDKFDMTRFFGLATEIHNYPEKGILGLPMCVYPSVVFYNKDIFDAAGVAYPPNQYGANYADGQPWDYDKVAEIARKMSLDAAGNNANSPAFDPKQLEQWGWGGWAGLYFEDYAQKFGPENGRGVSIDNRTALFTTQTYKDALKWTKSTIWDWYISPNGKQAPGLNYKTGEPFGSGAVGMNENPSWVRYAWDSWNQTFRWNVAAVPIGPNGKIISITDADTFVIPKSAKHKDQAWQVIKWFYETNHLKELTNVYGCIPADKTLADGWAVELKARYPDIDTQVFIDSLEYADTPNHETWRPAYSRINYASQRAFYLVTTDGNLDSDLVLSDLQKEAQALLDDYWKEKP